MLSLWHYKVIYITYYIFSYSASSEFSGVTHDATAFVGCVAGKVCKIDLLLSYPGSRGLK
jgi:hypothetical protein